MSRSKANLSIIAVLLFATLAGTTGVAQNASCSVLPYGTALSEADLLEITGGSGVLVAVLASILLSAGTGVASDVAISLAMSDGVPSGEEMALSAVLGAGLGVTGAAATPTLAAGLATTGKALASGAALLKSSAVSAARWTACAAV